MENTSCGDKCPFVKMGACNSERECPNFMESWWTLSTETTPKLVADCAPKRLLIQQNALQLRVEQLQVNMEAQRNEHLVVGQHLKSMIDVCATVLEQQANIVELGLRTAPKLTVLEEN